LSAHALAAKLNAMPRFASRAVVRTLLAGLSVLPGAAAAEAQKTDSVWIRIGDRITGEVKSLRHALLKYSTDDLGTIYIEWDKVVRISSAATFEVQRRSGQKYSGTLEQVSNGWVVVGVDTLSLSDIVAITPLRQKLLDRVDGYLDLGFSFQKAHKAVQLTSGAKVVYRGPRIETTLEISTFREDRDDVSATSRLSGSLTERFLTAGRWSGGFVIGHDRNEELDLAGRTRIVGFGSRVLSRSNQIDFWATGGLVGTQERYFSTDSTTKGFEGLLGAAFSAFRYDHPKLDASITSQAYPSFSIPGRVRLQSDVRVSYELVKDFMLTVTLFDSYDSKPQSEGAEKNDYGTTLAISWTF
jgi:hypothetical protein